MLAVQYGLRRFTGVKSSAAGLPRSIEAGSGVPSKANTSTELVAAQEASHDLAWWCDKQVAIVFGVEVVRGWVAQVTSHSDRDASGLVGELTLVVFIDAPDVARRFPATVTRAIRGGHRHGRPDGVLGVWAEGDLTDVHLRRGATKLPPTAVPTHQPPRRPSTRRELRRTTDLLAWSATSLNAHKSEGRFSAHELGLGLRDCTYTTLIRGAGVGKSLGVGSLATGVGGFYGRGWRVGRYRTYPNVAEPLAC